MSKRDDVYCADLAAFYRNDGPKEPPHCPPGFYWCPAPPEDCYFEPHHHHHHHHCDCDCKPEPKHMPEPEPEIEVKKSSTEGQICKLSKKAAALNRLLANMTDKKKDVIIKIGDTSFNFGNIDAEFAGWVEGDDKSYAATVKKIIEHQRALVMAEIKELADALDDEAEETSNVEGAITGGGN